MREDIKQLIELQELDMIKDDIEGRLRELPELIKEEEDECYFKQHFLYFNPLPHGHFSLRGILITFGNWKCFSTTLSFIPFK